MNAYKQHVYMCPTELSNIMQRLKNQLTKMFSTGDFTSVVRGRPPQIITDLHTYIY